MAEKFDVWAPHAKKVSLALSEGRVAMSPVGGGWWRASKAPSGEVDYGYLLDDADKALPDPRSRRQPQGVHNLSRTFDPLEHVWQDGAWKGRQLAGGSIYELHIGTFTPEGTLDAAAAKLRYLVDLGIDFVELLPVNAFNGTHNWGYDGVLWYAVQEEYGGPAAYQRFVDAAHRSGIGVIQDVVYNHLGPSGNYLPRFGPYMSSGKSNTWGESINLDGPDSGPVRQYIVDNALMWLRDYHVDGLRLDAVHALADHTAVHLLEEMATKVDVLAAQLGKPLFLVAESDLNDPKLITPREANGYGLAGQWSDDFHHAVHVNVTGETAGYYEDFNSVGALAKVVTRGFYHDGTMSTFRDRIHGRPVDLAKTPTWRFVVCIQNHDQVGNRAIGDRISATEGYGRLAVAAVLNLTSPFTPMLFMGEEYGASTPWQFFTSHPEPELGKATAEGRIKEFERMGWDAAMVPDPQDPATFSRSKLDWSEQEDGDHARLLELYRSLLRLRRDVPELNDPRFGKVSVQFDEGERWFLMRRGAVTVAVNFAEETRTVPVQLDEILLSTDGGSGTGAGGLELGPSSAVIGRTA